MNRADLQSLAEARVEDARVLLANGRYAAAYYLCGYAVECGIKACVARQIVAGEYPPDRQYSNDLFSHDRDKLLVRAELVSALATERAKDSALRTNWDIVKEWSESTRYESKNQQDATRLLDAIADPDHGVLRWLRLHW